jgi:hypothetical protein
MTVVLVKNTEIEPVPDYLQDVVAKVSHG